MLKNFFEDMTAHLTQHINVTDSKTDIQNSMMAQAALMHSIVPQKVKQLN